MKLNMLLSAATLAVMVSVGPVAHAQHVITDSSNSYQVGIGSNGELYDFNSGVGFRRVSDGYDPLAPGTPRDSWGVSINGTGYYGDQADYGTKLAGTTQTIGANSAVSTSVTGGGLTVKQTYNFVSPNIVKITETVTNTSGASASVLFGRDVDWDVYPTEFNENTFGPTGSYAGVVGSSYYGFENPDPTVPYANSCFTGCNATSDLGGGIQVNLGTIAAGGSKSINYFYGISEAGQNVNQLISEAQGDGAGYIIATQSSENGAFPNLGANSAFIGVGAFGGVPEPATWAMLILGVACLGFSMRRQRRGEAVAAS